MSSMREHIKRHFSALKLRAIRIERGISLDDIANFTKLTKGQITGWELRGMFNRYKNKPIIYKAYGVTEEEVAVSERDIKRLETLLTNYSISEIRMALDLHNVLEREKELQRISDEEARNDVRTVKM